MRQFRNRLCLLLLLTFCWNDCIAISEGRAHTKQQQQLSSSRQQQQQQNENARKNVMIDYSYHYNVDSTNIASSMQFQLQQHWDQQQVDDNNVGISSRKDTIDIDISNTNSGDDGFQKICNAILNQNNDDTTNVNDNDKFKKQQSGWGLKQRHEEQQQRQRRTTFIRLYSRMNSITPKGVTYLLNQLITLRQQQQQQQRGLNTLSSYHPDSNNETSTKTSTIPTDYAIEEEEDEKAILNITATDVVNSSSTTTAATVAVAATNSKNTTSTVTMHPPKLIETLDLSFNKLENNNNDDNYRKIEIEFRTKLETILSDPTICPSNIIFDRCCLSMITCRSIAQGLTSRYNSYHKKNKNVIRVSKGTVSKSNNKVGVQQKKMKTKKRKQLTNSNPKKISFDGNNESKKSKKMKKLQKRSSTLQNSDDENDRISPLSVENSDDDLSSQTKHSKTVQASSEATAVSSSFCPPPPLSLSLCGNKGIGDAGTAALAAAIRSIIIDTLDCTTSSYANVNTINNDGRQGRRIDVSSEERYHYDDNRNNNYVVILNKLDLSACNVGDIGVQALGIALEECNDSGISLCPVKQLDLSYNRITDQGVMYLGKAIQKCSSGRTASTTSASNNGVCYSNIQTLNLSGNGGITDRGLSSLFLALQNGNMQNLILQSCSIGADGMEQLGKALRQLISFLLSDNENNNYKHDGDDHVRSISIDVSGNALGMLRGKSKSGSLTSKATSTATAYMNTGMSFLKKAGLVFPNTVESDDEEEAEMKQQGCDGSDDDVDPSRGRCALKALSNSFTEILSSNDKSTKDITKRNNRTNRRRFMLKLGLRHTFCDMSGADALAFMIVTAKDISNNQVDIKLDMDLNPILEEEMIDALHGKDDYTLRIMAERHENAMQSIRESRDRAMEAARIARSRSEAQSVLDGFSMNQYRPDSVDDDNYSSDEEGLYTDDVEDF